MTPPVVPAATTVVVTGATSGIGLESAVQLAAQGHSMVLVGRDPGRLTAATERVRAAGAPRVDALRADFAVLDSVRALVEEIRSRHDRIDVLVNNAGAVFDRRILTADGHESTFAVNHLAGFLLTEGVKDLVPSGGRIVITSSAAHRGATLDLDDPGFAGFGYSIMRAYGRSKLANVLHTRDLAVELEPAGVIVNALHPGAVATSIWAGAPWYARPVLAAGKLLMRSPADGGRALTFLAEDASVAGATGGYYEKNRLVEPSATARDAALGARLRDKSAELVGLDREGRG